MYTSLIVVLEGLSATLKMGCVKRSKEFIGVTQHCFKFRADQTDHLCLTGCHIVCLSGMFTKPVKVPMSVRESLAFMINLLTHQNRNHFRSSPLMPYGGSVRYISLGLKYRYLETRFDKLNFMSTATIRSMH